MPLTITNVEHPNQKITEFPLGPWKARIIDVAFDNSYPTAGEVMTAVQLGWNVIAGVVVVRNAQNRASANTLSLGVEAEVNAAQTQVELQLYETAGTVDTPHKEFNNTGDASAYTCRLMVFGA